jgi:hypothetical protein
MKDNFPLNWGISLSRFFCIFERDKAEHYDTTFAKLLLLYQTESDLKEFQSFFFEFGFKIFCCFLFFFNEIGFTSAKIVMHSSFQSRNKVSKNGDLVSII